ncbi:MAG: hypothetical protein PW788_11485 [Micavibrio sp.]|nr:hypothetical protein [Micavibrio sp.]
MPNVLLRNFVAAFALTAALSACTTDGTATSSSYNGDGKVTASNLSDARNLPPLTVTNTPAPDVIYREGSADTVLASTDVQTPYYKRNIATPVTAKVKDLDADLSTVRSETAAFDGRLEALQGRADADARAYYELVAAINTELQSGTTPGNPELQARWNTAQNKLDSLSNTAGALNGLSTDLAAEATKAAYLQDNVRATYGLSGAVKADHDQLHVVEDGVNQQIVNINRQLTAVNDEINRRSAYLRSERMNMQTLSLAISNGELYGQNISNNLYTRATQDGSASFKSAPMAAPAQRRPLVIIRFDRDNVNYQQALYTAVTSALDKYPAAKFEIDAVSTSRGNPAEVALASSEARKNGEGVMRSLSQMGLPVERVKLNAATSPDVRNSEVHVYMQ